MPGIVKVSFLADVGKAKLGLTQFSSDVQDTVDKSGEAWSGLKDTLKVGALAAGAAAGAALAEGMDVDAARDKLSAQLGLVGPEAAKVGAAAGDLFSDAYGESIDDVSETLKAAIQNGVTSAKASREELKAVGADIQNFITLTGETAGATTEAVAQILKNKLAPNAKAAFDLLVRGQELGINKSEDLLDTFNEYSTQFRALGLDGPKALGLLNQGLKAGARDADTVADSLKEFAIRAKDGSATTVDGFKSIGLNAKQMQAVFAKGGPGAAAGLGLVLDKIRAIKDPAEQSRVAVELFGTKSEDMQAALLALDPSTAVKGLGELEGAADRAGNTLNDNAKSRFTAWKRTLQTNVTNFVINEVIPRLEQMKTKFGTAIAPILPPLKQLATTVAGTLVPAFRDMATFVQQNAAFFGPFAATILAIAAAVKIWAIAQGALNALMAANPIGLVVIAIAAAVGAVVYAYKNFEGFRNVVNNAWASLKTFTTFIAGVVGPVIRTVVSGAIAGFKAGLDKVRQALADNKPALDKVRAAMAAVGAFVTGTLVPALGRLISFIAGKVGPVLGFLARSQLTLVGSAIATVVRVVGTLISGFSRLAGGAQSGVSKVVGVVKGLRGAIQSAIGGLGGLLVNAGRELINGLISGISDKIGALRAKASEVAGAIKGFFPGSPVKEGPLTSWNNGGAGKKLAEMLADGLGKGAGAVAQASAGLAGSVQVGFTDVIPAGVTGPALSMGSSLGGPVVVNVYALQDGPAVGRRVVDVIKEYEAINGAGWRKVTP